MNLETYKLDMHCTNISVQSVLLLPLLQMSSLERLRFANIYFNEDKMLQE